MDYRSIIFVIVCLSICGGTSVLADASDGNDVFKSRAYFGAKLEPKDTVLHGAGQDVNGFLDYCNVLGPDRTPQLYMTYIGLGRPVSQVTAWGERLKKELEESNIEGLVPQVGVSLTRGGKEAGDGGEKEIADGSKDESIEAFCEALKALNRPVFVRIGYEFEGSWNGYRPDTYKAAFIRITKALRKHKINAATVWCSAGASAGNVPHEWVMKYYPGDEWVDWWGVDIFSPQEILSEKVRTFCADSAKHKKPVMIGESTPRYVGVLKGKASWDEWFRPYFKLIRTRPEIKAFCYINWEWAYWSDKLGFQWHDWGDCRIEQNEYVTRMYKDEMDSPLYEHLKQDKPVADANNAFKPRM